MPRRPTLPDRLFDDIDTDSENLVGKRSRLGRRRTAPVPERAVLPG